HRGEQGGEGRAHDRRDPNHCAAILPIQNRISRPFATANMHRKSRLRALSFRRPLLYLRERTSVTSDPGEARMAMTMNGEVQLPASREAVWAKLNDPEVLKACIPGCEELEKTDDGGFRAVAKMKVGPVSARFKGKVTLSDLDPPNGYKISGEGEGGVAGFAKGGATVK